MDSFGRKRTFKEIRELILSVLSSGRLTTNQISIKTGVNWRTVESHLTFLMGKALVREVLKSEYVRIFELSGLSPEYKQAKPENIAQVVRI